MEIATASAKFTVHKLDYDKDKVIDNLFKLQDMWVSRSDDFPFYTLGRSAYLDGKTPEYKKAQKSMNKTLYGNFEELYNSVLLVLQDKLNEKIYLPKDLCYPGFHIFPSDKKLLSIAGNWHEDYPHETLEIGNQDTSTFTVAILLPESGGGIDCMIDNMPLYIGYKENEMLWHDGTTLHRIASYNQYKPNEYRITLQGHLIRRNNKMEVFW
jgi:hypothetical protein